MKNNNFFPFFLKINQHDSINTDATHSRLAEAVHDGELIEGPPLEARVDPARVGGVAQLDGADVRQSGVRHQDANGGASSLQRRVLAPVNVT